MNDMMDIMSMLEEMGLNEEVLMAVGMAAGVLLLIAGIVNLLLYIFRASGLHTIAKRRGIRHAWLAWIPVADYWVAGSLSDQYRKTVKGKNSSNRIILLILAIVSSLVSAILSGLSLGMMAEMFEYIADGQLEDIVYSGTLVAGSSELLSLLADGLSLALLVFWQITLYDIYCSACPRNKVVFLVLGIIFPITVPFFLFYNRNKDEGMRIPEPEAYIPPADTTTEYL